MSEKEGFVMAKVEAIYLRKKGRFVVLRMENLPKDLPWPRFIIPHETFELGDRVQMRITLAPKQVWSVGGTTATTTVGPVTQTD